MAEPSARSLRRIEKSSTGIAGLDEVTRGGLPTRRTTVVLGNPGCGKTLLAAEFLIHGTAIGEPGVLLAVEQSRHNLIEDAASVGIDLERLENEGKLALVVVDLTSQDFVEAGSYSLAGLERLLLDAARRIGAKRIVIDQLDGFFDCFSDAPALRKEFLRLAGRFSDLGLTTLMTGAPPGRGHRIEEFLSDCVLHLDHRVVNQVGTRRLRVLKYRGTAHGTDEYPFAITSTGLRVFPITSSTLNIDVSDELLSTGLDGMDELLGGGYYRGSALLISGEAGTGKTTLACQLAAAAAAAGNRCSYVSFEESPHQLMRNARSVGLA